MGSNSFEAVYAEYFKKVYNYIYGQVLNRETAEDLTEDVFIRVYDNFAFYNPNLAALSTWIYTIAKNVIINHQRRGYVNREVGIDESVEELGTNQKYFYDNPNTLKFVENRQLFNILRELSEAECELLEMRYGLELSNEEISKLLNSNAKAVSARFNRLLEKCRKINAELRMRNAE